MDYKEIASEILENVGGAGNVKDLSHCFTRLRFVLKDPNLANKEAVERTEGVIQVVVAGGQFQVVCGSKVNKIYDEILPMVNVSAESGEEIEEEKGSLWNWILQTISKIFTPLVPAIAASGLIKGILSIVTRAGWMADTNSTYVILNCASNIIFYFMPVFLAYTTADTLKCNKVNAMVLGGFLCHPTIEALMTAVDEFGVLTKSTIFGLPVIKCAFTIGESTRIFSYTESVIPIILAVILLCILEKFLYKVIPEMFQIILVPGLCLLIMVPVTLVVVGPVGIYVGYIMQWLYQNLYDFNHILGGAVIGGLWGVCVIFGAHRALLPIGLNDVAISGTNTLMCFAGSANFSQAGAALGVMLKTKSRNLRQVAGAAALSAGVVGITEPAIYGCNLRLKRPMVCAIIAGAAGGAIMGIGNAVNTGFANNGVLTIATYYGEGTSFGQFMAYIIGICVAFFGAAILTYIVGFEDDKDPVPAGAVDATALNAPGNTISAAATVTDQERQSVSGTPVSTNVYACADGNVIDISQVKDEVFNSGALGKGVGIEPKEGHVYAPADCDIALIAETKHAIGLTLPNGAELIIHIGLDTVKLNGQYFTQRAQEGAHVKKGDPIMDFDLDAIKAAGYDPTVCFVVSNTDAFPTVNTFSGFEGNVDTPVIEIIS